MQALKYGSTYFNKMEPDIITMTHHTSPELGLTQNKILRANLDISVTREAVQFSQYKHLQSPMDHFGENYIIAVTNGSDLEKKICETYPSKKIYEISSKVFPL